MIIKSSQRAGHGELANHLMKLKDIDGTPQTVTVSGSRYLVCNDNVHTALRDMEIISMASQRCRKDLYHISMNPDQVMMDEDWQLAWDAYEEEFGLSHLPYIEVTHDKGKHRQPHKHRVYERVDVDTGKAVQLSHTRIRNEKVARTVEFELGHKLTVGKHNRTVIRQFADDGREDIIVWMEQGHAHDCNRPTASQNHADVQMEKRTALPMQQVKADLQECYEASPDGEGFRAVIAEKGYLLAKGDKRDYVIVDWMGGLHSPRRRLGVKAKELKERWTDLDRQQLDSVEETLRLLKVQWAASANTATTGEAEEDSTTAAKASAGRRVANDDKKPLSQLKEDASALEKEIAELQEQLGEQNTETANRWQRHTREPESESARLRRNVAKEDDHSSQQHRGRSTNTTVPDVDTIVTLSGDAAIAERQRRLLALQQQVSGQGLSRQPVRCKAQEGLPLTPHQHTAVPSEQSGSELPAGQGDEQKPADSLTLENALAEYQQLWQQRFNDCGNTTKPAVQTSQRHTGAQYRLADRFILQRLAAIGHSRQQARRVLMQASPEVMNQRPGDRLRYVRRLTDRVYSQHEQQRKAQQKQETRTRQQKKIKDQNQKQGREQGSVDSISRPICGLKYSGQDRPEKGKHLQRLKEPEIER